MQGFRYLLRVWSIITGRGGWLGHERGRGWGRGKLGFPPQWRTKNILVMLNGGWGGYVDKRKR